MRIGLGSREPLCPAGPRHGSPCSRPPGSQRKRPRTPRHLGAFRGISSGGSQGAPGPFPLRTRLGASELLGTSRPADPRASGGSQGLLGRGLVPRGWEAQGAPRALRSRRDRRWTGGPGPGAYRPGGPWGSAALVTLRKRRGPRAPLGSEGPPGATGARGSEGAPNGAPEGPSEGLRGAPGVRGPP